MNEIIIPTRDTDGWPFVLPNDDGIRPAGPRDACLYCGQKIGQRHGSDCVCITKKVKVRYTYEIEIEVPHAWTKEDIERHRNESSWCADNSLDEIEAFHESLGETTELPGGTMGPCLCDYFSCEYVADVDGTPIQKPPRTDEDAALQDRARDVFNPGS